MTVGDFVILGLVAVGVLFVFAVVLPMAFRIVVSTNDVHIVQTGRATISYGKGQQAGNTYYAWPSWLPSIGVKVIKLPVSVFDVTLDSYAAYDQRRVPFQVDVMAFFRITESNVAAERIHSFNDLMEQLRSILQGSVRSILATSDIETILEGRKAFGEKFTDEVDSQLKEWGVQTVKCIELMDIRDAAGSQVISNIMAKQKSAIEMESRIAVANNQKAAQVAEIMADRDVKTQQQEAQEQVGLRTAGKEKQIGGANADRDKEIGIRTQVAQQEVAEQRRITAEKEMAVRQVTNVRAAEIEKSVQVVAATQKKEVAVVEAEGEKQRTILIADGTLEAARRHAAGIEAEGLAKATADKAIQLAPVAAQIELAREIGESGPYQTYLLTLRRIEADQVIGVEQAKALEAAQIKVIANSAGPVDGVKTVMDMFTPKGGTQLGAALEAFKNTEAGAEVMGALAGGMLNTKGNGAAKR